MECADHRRGAFKEQLKQIFQQASTTCVLSSADLDSLKLALTDVWSEIRKDAARVISKYSENLCEDILVKLYYHLVNPLSVCLNSSGDGTDESFNLESWERDLTVSLIDRGFGAMSWQSVHGLLLGVVSMAKCLLLWRKLKSDAVIERIFKLTETIFISFLNTTCVAVRDTAREGIIQFEYHISVCCIKEISQILFSEASNMNTLKGSFVEGLLGSLLDTFEGVYARLFCTNTIIDSGVNIAAASGLQLLESCVYKKILEGLRSTYMCDSASSVRQVAAKLYYSIVGLLSTLYVFSVSDACFDHNDSLVLCSDAFLWLTSADRCACSQQCSCWHLIESILLVVDSVLRQDVFMFFYDSCYVSSSGESKPLTVSSLIANKSHVMQIHSHFLRVVCALRSRFHLYFLHPQYEVRRMAGQVFPWVARYSTCLGTDESPRNYCYNDSMHCLVHCRWIAERCKFAEIVTESISNCGLLKVKRAWSVNIFAKLHEEDEVVRWRNHMTSAITVVAQSSCGKSLCTIIQELKARECVLSVGERTLMSWMKTVVSVLNDILVDIPKLVQCLLNNLRVVSMDTLECVYFAIGLAENMLENIDVLECLSPVQGELKTALFGFIKEYVPFRSVLLDEFISDCAADAGVLPYFNHPLEGRSTLYLHSLVESTSCGADNVEVNPVYWQVETCLRNSYTTAQERGVAEAKSLAVLSHLCVKMHNYGSFDRSSPVASPLRRLKAFHHQNDMCKTISAKLADPILCGLDCCFIDKRDMLLLETISTCSYLLSLGFSMRLWDGRGTGRVSFVEAILHCGVALAKEGKTISLTECTLLNKAGIAVVMLFDYMHKYVFSGVASRHIKRLSAPKSEESSAKRVNLTGSPAKLEELGVRRLSFTLSSPVKNDEAGKRRLSANLSPSKSEDFGAKLRISSAFKSEEQNEICLTVDEINCTEFRTVVFAALTICKMMRGAQDWNNMCCLNDFRYSLTKLGEIATKSRQILKVHEKLTLDVPDLTSAVVDSDDDDDDDDDKLSDWDESSDDGEVFKGTSLNTPDCVESSELLLEQLILTVSAVLKFCS